jgi:hypothetical protein
MESPTKLAVRTSRHLDLAQRGFAIGAVDIDDKDSRRLASGDGDIEIGLLLPPAPDDGQIDRGVLAAVGRRWHLVSGPAWKNMPAPLRQCQRMIEHGAQPSQLKSDLVVHVVLFGGR